LNGNPDFFCARYPCVFSILWELLFQCGIKHGAKVVKDKSLDSVRYTMEFLRLFNDMLFVDVVRDLRIQIDSINHAVTDSDRGNDAETSVG
jgi:hypothetical protein